MPNTYDNHKRFSNMAEVYDKAAPYMVPAYDFLQTEIFKIIPYEKYDSFDVVDLGGGSGIFLEKVLDRYPNSYAYWVDSSEPFMNIAQERLKRFSERVTFLNMKFTDDWESKIEENPDFIFSMSAIHHLDTQGKQKLYKRIYDKLIPRGWFINIDEMKTLSDDAYYRSLLFWKDHAEKVKGQLPEELKEYYKEWMLHFEQWEKRNIQEFDREKSLSAGDDLHESFLDQINWLVEIGFESVDIFYKYHLWCAVGGWKGESIIPNL